MSHKASSSANFQFRVPNAVSRWFRGGKPASKSVNYFPGMSLADPKKSYPSSRLADRELADNMLNTTGVTNTYPNRVKNRIEPPSVDNMTNRTGTTKTFKNRQYIYPGT